MCSQDAPAMPAAAALACPVVSEPARKMRPIAELKRDFRRRQAELASTQQGKTGSPAAVPAKPEQLSREWLLAARQISLQLLQKGPASNMGWRCISLKQTPPGLHLGNKRAPMADATGSQVETVLKEGAVILPTPLKQRDTETCEPCASTASGSSTHSEGPSSPSTPRSVALASATLRTLNPEAAPFVPSTLNANAEPFTPSAVAQFQ